METPPTIIDEMIRLLIDENEKAKKR